MTEHLVSQGSTRFLPEVLMAVIGDDAKSFPGLEFRKFRQDLLQALPCVTWQVHNAVTNSSHPTPP